MLEQWDGADMENSDEQLVTVRALVLVVSSELPAARKVTQFLGHSANKVCHVCLLKRREKEREIGVVVSQQEE